MQTFLPYADFEESARCLDYRRLGKQRVEAMQILKCLRGEKDGWKNHPAVKMWKGYEKALAKYMNVCIDEWVRRGYNNNMIKESVDDYILPEWFGNDLFHDSHKSNLLRKNQEFYSQYNWNVSNDLPYQWYK